MDVRNERLSVRWVRPWVESFGCSRSDCRRQGREASPDRPDRHRTEQPLRGVVAGVAGDRRPRADDHTSDDSYRAARGVAHCNVTFIWKGAIPRGGRLATKQGVPRRASPVLASYLLSCYEGTEGLADCATDREPTALEPHVHHRLASNVDQVGADAFPAGNPPSWTPAVARPATPSAVSAPARVARLTRVLPRRF